MGPTGSSGPPGPRTHGGGPSTCGGTGQLGRKRLRHSPHPTARGDSSLEAGGSWDGTAVTGDKAPHPTRHAGRSTHGAGRGCGQVEVHQRRLGRALTGGRVCSLHTAAGTGGTAVSPDGPCLGPPQGPVSTRVCGPCGLSRLATCSRSARVAVQPPEGRGTAPATLRDRQRAGGPAPGPHQLLLLRASWGLCPRG